MKIDPSTIRIAMLKKRITSAMLQQQLNVGKSAISMALSGQREALLKRIADHLKAH